MVLSRRSLRGDKNYPYRRLKKLNSEYRQMCDVAPDYVLHGTGYPRKTKSKTLSGRLR